MSTELKNKNYMNKEGEVIAKSPVIFDIAYVPYRLASNATREEIEEHRKRREFYDMSGKENIYKYITTEGKVYGESTKKITMLEYLQKSTGVFNAQGMLSKDEVKAIKARAKIGEKNIWSGFISFSKEDSNYIDSPDKCIELVKQTFSKFFADAGFEPSNMDLMCALHLDKPEHLHIHYIFFEKEPKVKNKRARGYLYRKKGKIPLEIIEKMTKRLNDYTLPWELDWKHFQHKNKLQDRADYKVACNEDYAVNCIKKLAKILPQESPLWYASKEMRPYRKQIDSCVEEVLGARFVMYKKLIALQDRLQDVQDKIAKSKNQYYNVLSSQENEKKELFDLGDASYYAGIKTVKGLEWDCKRRMGNILLRHMGYIQENTYKRNPKVRYKTNDKNLKRCSTIANRKIKSHINKFLGAIEEMFTPIINNTSNRLREIEQEWLDEKQNEAQKQQQNSRSKYDWGK